jgi:hypothetical protein
MGHLCKGFNEGDLEGGGPLLGTQKDTLSKAWKWASASVGVPLLGNMEGSFFLRAFLLMGIFIRFSRYAKCPVNRYLSP